MKQLILIIQKATPDQHLQASWNPKMRYVVQAGSDKTTLIEIGFD